MRFNTYRQAMEALRNREAFPPFEEIRTRVLYEKPSRKILPIPFWLLASAGIPSLVALSLLLFPEMFGLQRVDRRSSMIDGRPSSILNRQSSSAMNVNNDLPFFASNHGLRTTNREPRIANHESQINAAEIENPKFILEKNSQKEVPPSVKTEEMKTTESQATPIHPVSEQQENSVSTPRFYAFLSGGFPIAQAGVSYQQLLPFSAGIRYEATPASSVLLELRKNVFVQRYTPNKISFHDTILTLGGQPYQNTIGQLFPTQVQSANTFYSINAGYRFSFGRLGAFSPFAEVFLGACHNGALLSEAAGIEYSFHSPFSFELGLRNDQLYSPSSSPLAAFTFNASINYAW